MAHYHEEGTEADYMHDCQLAASGGDPDRGEPTHEVVNGQNDVLFLGSRAACWSYKRQRGGYVREWSGDDCDYFFEHGY